MLGCAGGLKNIVYVRLPDTTTRGIPSWMLDEAVCDGMSVIPRPVIAPQALRALADLLLAIVSQEKGNGKEGSPHER
ncbi:MAG: hypothetical protein EOP86_23490 [Verrucomicrobiaceae bacterium]|nr:MAG: hypothetical protein EOP86_23490 [Verrucomicrobiaceae bacterium]